LGVTKAEVVGAHAAARRTRRADRGDDNIIIMAGDNDGDVCILKDDKENTEKVQNIVQRMGGKFFYWGAFRVFDKDIFIDIFLVKEHEIKDTKHLIFPTIKETVCLGDNKIIATIPNKPKEFLEARYGKDWTVQKYKWYFLYF
jgi:hypothetical protein